MRQIRLDRCQLPSDLDNVFHRALESQLDVGCSDLCFGGSIELDSRCQPWAGDARQRAGVIVVVVRIELDSRCQPWAGKVATGRRSTRLA